MTGIQEMTELDMSKRLKNFLEDEWNFTKRVCPHIRGGEAKAANRFWLVWLFVFFYYNYFGFIA